MTELSPEKINELKVQGLEDAKLTTIAEACELIKKHNGEFSYFDIGRILAGSKNTENQMSALLALAVICHNIPYYKNGERCLRNLNECLRDVITFYNANKDEGEIIYISNDPEAVCCDVMTSYKLPALNYADDTHNVFKSGSGSAKPDLVDSEGNTYEVKRNYKNGSRASLHKANYLIDCLNTTIEIRKIEPNGVIDLDHYPIARFNGFLTGKITSITLVTNADKELLEAIHSGELITSVEEQLAEDGFNWNP